LNSITFQVFCNSLNKSTHLTLWLIQHIVFLEKSLKREREVIMYFEFDEESKKGNEYESFLAKLRQLKFAKIVFVQAPRRDLTAFVGLDGLVTDSVPWFGDCYAQLGNEGRERAEKIYSYYFGQAGGDTGEDIFFCKKSRSGLEKVCFLPTYLPDSGQFTPRVGDIIFGHTGIGREGRGLRFLWWQTASFADKHFADLLCGRAIFSPGKLEKKLRVMQDGQPNHTLFLLAQALKKEPDLDFFVDLARSRKGMPIGPWLNHHISRIRPDFCAAFERAMQETGKPTPLDSGGVQHP